MKKLSKLIDKIGLSLFLAIMMPNFSFAADTGGDFSTVSKPIILLGKVLVLIMGILYLLIGLMWIWLPMIVVFMVKKHYEKKFEDRQEDNSKDMLMRLLISGFGSALVALLIIGFFGMIFFNADGLLSGIQSYYGGLISDVKSFMVSNLGISSVTGAAGAGAAGATQ